MYAISEKDVPGQGRHWKKIKIGELVESQIMTAGRSEMEPCIKVRSPDKVGQPEKKPSSEVFYGEQHKARGVDIS